MFASDLKALQESYEGIYEEGDGISCEMLEEIVEELIEECVEFGYTLNEASTAVENAAILYIDEAKVTYGSDTESPEQRRERAKAKVGEKKAAARKAAVKTAVGRAKAKAAGAVAGAGIAASIAKDTARRAGRTAVHKVTYGAQKKKEEVKSGVKSLIGRGLRKAAGAVGKVAQKAAGAASRLGEETQQIDEVSDRLARAARNTRDRRYNASFGDGGMSANYMKQNAKKDMLNKTLASRAARTGSKIKPVEEEVEAIQEADSLAAMAARREQRRKAAAKKEGRTMAGNLPGHDYSLTSAQQQARRDAEYKAGMKKEEVESVAEMNAGPSTPVKYDAQMRQLVPNQGAGRVGAVRLKTTMGLKKGGTVREDVYDIVLDYLMSDGHADTLEEAHYVMSQMDADHIQSIVENVMAGPVMKPGGGLGGVRPVFPAGQAPKPTGAQLPKFNKGGTVKKGY